MNRLIAMCFVAALTLPGRAADARQNGPGGPAAPNTAPAAADVPFTLEGPPAPIPPEVISRDDAGRATVRAVGLEAPLRIDGRLDEEVYARVPAMSGFIQMEPHE